MPQSSLFGYTGLAELGSNLRTDLWLTQVLSGLQQQSIDAAVEAIRTSATNYFRCLSQIDLETKRHAFVGVGWAIPSNENSFSPLLVQISNFHNQKNPLAYAKEEFEVSVDFLQQRHHGASNVTGRPLSSDVHIELQRNLRKCTKKQAGPAAVIAFMASAIRTMSSRFEDVGSNLMALSIPKSTLNYKSSFYWMAPPSLDAHTFLYLPADRDDSITYGPNYVCGGTALTDYKHVSGKKAEAYMKSMPSVSTLDFYKSVVLTDWHGSGTREDTYRPAVSDDYRLEGFGAITDIPSWPNGEKSPYYGYLVGISADDDTVDSIRNDSRFHVVYCESDKRDIPDEQWLQRLGTWLADRDMDTRAVSAFIQEIAELTRLQIVEELNTLLKQPKAKQLWLEQTKDSSSDA